MKIDPYKCKEKYLRWKKETQDGIPRLSKVNSDLIHQFLYDMESGLNISGSKKGARSYNRLLALKNRLIILCMKFNDIFNVGNITNITEEQIHRFFTDMRNGDIRKNSGEEYRDVSDLIKDFKTFWHWHMKVSKKRGKDILDITLDLDLSKDKPKWVYLNEEQVKKLSNLAKYEYKVLIMFLYDSGIRAPTELINVKVSDFYNDFKELNIRDEISKTFGRRIKIMFCSEMLKQYVKDKKLSENDQLFKINYIVANRYLKRLAKKVFGDRESLAGERYSKLTLYDFRHNSCCYWLPKYPSEIALKYRFGWKKSDKIHYYSELLGMRDTISEEDLLVDVTKTEIEKRLMISEKNNEISKERIKALEEQIIEIKKWAERIEERM
jgi:hypothetical protein